MSYEKASRNKNRSTLQVRRKMKLWQSPTQTDIGKSSSAIENLKLKINLLTVDEIAVKRR